VTPQGRTANRWRACCRRRSAARIFPGPITRMKQRPSSKCRTRLGSGRGLRPRFFGVLTAFVLLLLPFPAGAFDDPSASLYAGIWTKHVNPSTETNEDNGLIGVGYNDYILTTFENSYNQRTVFASKRFHTRRFLYDDDVGFFLQGNLYLGLFYGYTHNVPNLGGFTAAPLPTIGVGYRNASIELLYLPTPRGGFFLSFLSLRFGKNWHRPESHQVTTPDSPEWGLRAGIY